jgi:hypothetical protein
MHRIMLMSAALALLCLTPLAGSAAPTDRAVAAPRAPAITLVQGWWEQENRSDAPSRYWNLNHSQYNRYNSLEAQIQRRHRRYHYDQYDQRDYRDLREQHVILRFDFHP